MRSWFHHPTKGINAQFANIQEQDPKVPGHETPHISDLRIRYLFDGIENQDLFFYEEPTLWGDGLYNGNGSFYYNDMWDLCVTNNPIVNSNPDILNAVHVFMAGASVDRNDSTDIWEGPGAFTWMFSSCGATSDEVGIVNYGAFYRYYYDLTGQKPRPNIYINVPNPNPDPSAIPYGHTGLTVELFHMLTVDHTDGRHLNSNNGTPTVNDRCLDTPFNPGGDNNMMGNDPPEKDALTQCQIGRMHHFLEALSPDYVRTEENNFVFPAVTEFCNISLPDIVIPTGADITWSRELNLRSNVLVEPGATLTITCDLGMPENARITVKTGGKLNVYARIHNNCDNTYWDGIVVEGDPNYGDFPDFQGFCKIVNGTIENAYIGVRCQDGTPGNNVWGGIVWAASSTFLNCEKYAVEINSFGNIQPPSYYATGDANDFAFCNFIRDDSYFGGTGAFQGMVKLKSVRGIRIVGCTFSNTGPGSNLQEMGDGLISQNAGFSLQGFHVSGPIFNFDIPSNISGFRRGVFATSSYNTAIKITRSSFANNWIGVYANSCNNAMILKNEFDVGSDLALGLPAYAEQANIGIALYRSRGYKIEENEFRRHSGIETMNPVGIQVNASGPYSNEIYKNYFRDMFVSNVANGRNRTTDPNIGLQYFCNESQGGNTFDFSVKGGNNNPQAGIARNQGNTNLANGNTLTLPPPDPLTHFNNEEEDINYFHFTPPNEIPTNFTNQTVTLTPLNFENLCASKLPNDFDGEISGSEKQQLSSDFYNSTVAGEKSYSANVLVHHFLTDSIEYNLDSARFWLIEMGGLENHMQVVNTYIGEKDIQAAQAALVAIPNIVALEGEELNEYAYFDSLKTIQINALGIDQPEEQMVIQNQNLLTGIANAGEYAASAEAKILLNTVIGELYPHEIFLPTNNNGQQMLGQPSGQELTSRLSLEEYYLKAAPNPAKNQTVFHFQLPADEENGQIRVTSIDGRTISVIELGNRNGKIAWNTETLEKGIYLFSLWADGKQMLTDRLVILQ